MIPDSHARSSGLTEVWRKFLKRRFPRPLNSMKKLCSGVMGNRGRLQDRVYSATQTVRNVVGYRGRANDRRSESHSPERSLGPGAPAISLIQNLARHPNSATITPQHHSKRRINHGTGATAPNVYIQNGSNNIKLPCGIDVST